jgi:hypothetical protein
MLMNNNKQRIAQVVLGKLGGGASTEPSESVTGPGEDVSENMGLKSAAEKLLSAVHAKDASGVQDALSDFLDIHSSESEDEGEESEDEDQIEG